MDVPRRALKHILSFDMDRRRNWQAEPLDFTLAMSRLCIDITDRVGEFSHVDMSRVAVTFAQARRRVLHGLQAKLTPLRFEGGATTTQRQGRLWGCQKLMLGGREMLYILTFYLPRFLDQSFKEKMITVLHELYHISPEFNGDIRRFDGRCHVHTQSQKGYDAHMAQLASHYLASRPQEDLLEFLRCDFKTWRHRGGVVGLRIPVPKLIPIQNARTA
jgi:hypothetical protein